MYKLDMSFGNTKLWLGCKITPLGSDRYRLETLQDTAIKYLEARLDLLLEEILEADRDELVITGAVPQWVTATVTRRFAPAFKKLSIFNPNDRTTIEISRSPADTESAPD